MKEKLKIVLCILITIGLLAGLSYLVYQSVKAGNEPISNPVATFEIKDYGTIKMELYPKYAPNTVSNFVALINSGYYNNKVISGKDDICLYMARGANEDEDISPKISLINPTIEAGSENDYSYEINGEFIANGFEKNTIRHEKGTISLNHSDYSTYGLKEEGYNSGNAQFSVMMKDNSNLNGVYCAFGKVIEGLEILENIYNTAQAVTDENSQEGSIQEFSTMPVITSATVDTKGIDYGTPETHEAFDIQEYVNKLYSSYYSN